MKTLITAEAISKGGRSGTIESPDGIFQVELGNPLDKDNETQGPNPEWLFAGAYAACYHGALGNAVKKFDVPDVETKVRALVSLNEDEKGGYVLSVALHAELPGIEPLMARRIMEEAHKTCPYSRALRAGASVTLVLDQLMEHANI